MSNFKPTVLNTHIFCSSFIILIFMWTHMAGATGNATISQGRDQSKTLFSNGSMVSNETSATYTLDSTDSSSPRSYTIVHEGFSKSTQTIQPGDNHLNTSSTNAIASNSTQGKYWDEEKGVNLDSIWGDVTNLEKDLSPDIKELIAGKLTDFDISPMTTNVTVGGVPVEYIDLGPAGISTVVYESQLPIAFETQYKANVDYAAALGPIGNMDYRNGVCFIDGQNYTGLINAYLYGPAPKFEGLYPYLHLDSECWITIGIGSALFVPGGKKNYDSYKKYFNSMQYVDAQGIYVSQKLRDKDIALFIEKEKNCLATGKEKGKSEKHFKEFTAGRHITNDCMYRLAFEEACDRMLPVLIEAFKKEAAKQKSHRTFNNISLTHQLVVMDISYQGGVYRFTNHPKITGKYTMRYVRNAIVKNDCKSAEAAFNKTYLNSTKHNNKERLDWRKKQLREGCDVSNKGTASKQMKQSTNKKTTVKKTSKTPKKKK